MTILHQLIRDRFKTLLGIILIMIACILLCVSLGQYFASVLSRRQVEAEYTTIALPTDKFQAQDLIDEQGKTIGVTYLHDQPPEVQNILSDLADLYPRAVKAVEQHGLISGYCNGMELLNYTQVLPLFSGDGLTAIRLVPYTCAMFEIMINEISDVSPFLTETTTWPGMNPDDYGVAADVTGTVLEVCALQSGYENPEGRTIHLKVRSESLESFSTLGLEIGKKYLVYGTDYTDLNWDIKCRIAMGNEKTFDNICWENIVYLTEEEKNRINANNDLYGITEDSVALYTNIVDGVEYGQYLKESDLEKINSCSMTVCANPNVLRGQLTEEEISLYSGGEMSIISPQEYGKRYQQAGIAELDSPADRFLEAPDNQIWQMALQEAEVNNHSFPIIATDNLQSIAQFGAQDAFISGGRRFLAEEYEQGKQVCIISETLAVQNDLSVGDHISIRYYEYDYNVPRRNFLQTANPFPHFYSLYEGFSSEEISYEIVGLYRQKQEWTTDDYSFTPNTIFVPKQSVCGQTETSSSGVFCTFVLENGMMQWLEEELTALGYDGLLAYYDQGYSDIAASLLEYFAVARRILVAGLASWCVLVAVFLFLFPGHQKQTAKRMWTLGAPRSWVVKHILVSGMGIVLPGLVLGGAVSAALMQSLPMQTGDAVSVSLELPQALLVAVILVLVQLAVLVCLTLAAAGRTTRSFYKK